MFLFYKHTHNRKKKTLKIEDDNFHKQKKTKYKIQKQDISCMKPC